MSEPESLPSPEPDLTVELLKASDMQHWDFILDYVSLRHEDIISLNDYLTAEQIVAITKKRQGLSHEQAEHIREFVVPALSLSGYLEPTERFGQNGVEAFDISHKGQELLERTWSDNAFRQRVGLTALSD